MDLGHFGNVAAVWFFKVLGGAVVVNFSLLCTSFLMGTTVLPSMTSVDVLFVDFVHMNDYTRQYNEDFAHT